MSGGWGSPQYRLGDTPMTCGKRRIGPWLVNGSVRELECSVRVDGPRSYYKTPLGHTVTLVPRRVPLLRGGGSKDCRVGSALGNLHDPALGRKQYRL